MEHTRKQAVIAYLQNEYILTENEDLKLYSPKTTETFTDTKNDIRKVEIGQRNINVPEKVVMIVGSTGSGKSSFINSFFNYIVGVEWQDDFRVKLIEEGTAKSQAHAQTNMVTAYTIYHKSHYSIPYNITIVDTPGYGDPEGLVKDTAITASIEKFFKTEGTKGIDRLDAVGFVVPSTLARLTPTQRYIFNSILSLFGKNIEDNIFMLVTHADGQTPEVLSGLKEAQVPYKAHYEFNNSAVFSATKINEGEPNLKQEFWTLNQSNFETFAKELNEVDARSLVLTQKVLRERSKLEIAIKGIHRNIKMLLYQLERLSLEREVIKQHLTEVDESRNVDYEAIQETVEKEPTLPGQTTTNCTKCKITCHEKCPIEQDDKKGECLAMTKGHCTVCPENCHWTEHKNEPFVYAVKTQSKILTTEDLQRKYQSNKEALMTSALLIDELTAQIEATRNNIISLAIKAAKSIAKLDKIALRPSPLSTVDYIDQLIIEEMSEGKPRWKERVEQLKRVKWKARYIEILKNPAFPGLLHQTSKDESEETAQISKKNYSLSTLCIGRMKEHMTTLSGEEELITDTFVRHVESIRRPLMESKCPITMVKNLRQYSATVSEGEARILQGKLSDVSLSIPKGSRGVFTSRVHTDHLRFKDVIDDDECLIGPPVEFEHEEKETHLNNVYVIKIPHCLPDKELWKDIKVRKGKIHKPESFEEVPKKSKHPEGDMHYEIDDKYIFVHTKHFSDLICTVCKRTCTASAMVFLFGKMETDNPSQVQIKAFLCSKLFITQDFKSNLKKVNQEYGLKSLAEKNMVISKTDFEPRYTEATMTMRADDAESSWIPATSTSSLWNATRKLFVTSRCLLNSVMDLDDGCHLCRSTYPTDAMTVDVKNESNATKFKGEFQIVVHVAVVKDSHVLFRDNIVDPIPFSINMGSHLIDEHLDALSQRITDSSTMRRLGIELRLPSHTIEGIQSDYPSKTEAAHKMLCTWFQKQTNTRTAYTELTDALKRAELNLFISQILEEK